MSIAISGLHLNDIVTHFKDRNIKCAASEIKDNNLFILLFVKAIRKRCCRRLVDNTLHVEPCDPSCVFCCLTL
jgi:hypothetical protein